VHHRTYERFGREDTGDLTVLCRRCHTLFHGVVEGHPKGPSPNDTEREIARRQTKGGGWTRKTFKEWGLPWPPPKGWKQDLVRRDALASKGAHGK
jgi:hypothetical protein